MFTYQLELRGHGLSPDRLGDDGLNGFYRVAERHFVGLAVASVTQLDTAFV
jgi:hypothetical protein